MDSVIEDSDEDRFANGQSDGDSRSGSSYMQSDSELDLEALPERSDSNGLLEALKPSTKTGRPARAAPAGESGRDRGASGDGFWRKRITRKILLIALLVLAVGAVAPFAWKYLQSYESTDDAQIDGHIDPLSSRIDGTVIRVHVEDDERVKKGELLVEIDLGIMK